MSQLNPSAIECAGTLCLIAAIFHTFAVRWFQKKAGHYPAGSVLGNLFHGFGEIEIVFGLWSAVFFALMAAMTSMQEAVTFFEGMNFNEPLFIFVIMTISATQPILDLVERLIVKIAHLLPLPKPLAFYCVCLTVGSALGSLITEPAAMTVVALLLLQKFYHGKTSEAFRYATLGLLFVCISIGGTLTHFAAPPVLMVAAKWNWDSAYLFTHFGWKALIAICLATAWTAYRFRGELRSLPISTQDKTRSRAPNWIQVAHLLFLTLAVLSAHHPYLCISVLLFFLGFCTVTETYQSPLKMREALLVAFFLAGLVVLGSQQRWWLEPLLAELSAFSLFLGATLLTAVTDNAALTYLGAQVPNLSEFNQYALVAGAVTGGGLTVIANAPNPAGYGILNSAFGESGISAFRLFQAALIPTLIAGACFWLL